jgi:enoyl-CoA hydratase
VTDPLTEPILTHTPREGVLLITINRPERRNAFDRAASDALEAVLDHYDEDPSLRCAVITGAGETFCAGQDLAALAGGEVASTKRRGTFGMLAQPPVKPIIAAVEGHALGGGLELCLACDLIVASRTATLGLPETRRSVLALGGGLFRLPQRIPYHLAMEMALTGEPLPATELHQRGLINRLSEPGHAVDTALALADKVLEAAPLAVQASKRILVDSRDWTEAESWRRQRDLARPVHASADLREGLAAFAQKRRPVWSGE